MKHRNKIWKLLKNNVDGSLLWISMFFLLCALFIVKICIIYLSYKNLYPIKYCFAHFISDIYFFITIAFLLTIIFQTKISIIKCMCNTLIQFFLLLYCIDMFTIYYFLTRDSIFSIFEIIKYWWNWFTNVVLSRIIAYIITWWLCFFCARYKNYYRNFSSLFSPKWFILYYIIWIIIYLSQFFTTNTLISNTKNILSINIEAIQELLNNDILFTTNLDYEDYIYNDIWDNRDLNIILIFGESLSAIDSTQLWWNDNMPYFDKIQKNWITFTNFIANSNASIYAHLSTFLWVPPIKWWDYPYISEPLPKYLNDLWYNTIYISSASLNFLGEKKLLKSFWFAKTIWEDEFKNNKKYTFGAAPDGDLYDRVLEEIQYQTWKYFISLPTISFHTPYNTPYGDTQYEALKYADEKLYNFYTNLEKSWFFNSGLLMIIWDHRKREPAEPGEYEIFWPSWEYRSLATVIWSWIMVWSINNNIIQHTDFYYSIKKLLWNGTIQLDKTYNDVFSNNANRNRWITKSKFLFQKWNFYDLWNLNTLNKNHTEIYKYYISLKKFQLSKSIISKKL